MVNEATSVQDDIQGDIQGENSAQEQSASLAEQSLESRKGALKLRPEQEEMPFAMVLGKEYTVLPKDLYIPPDALEVFLEAFEGPLDLLLYLIRRQNLDILDINVAEITRQYMGYIELMSTIQLELAAEYLVMAAMLAEIKSRMLLPRQVIEDDDEEDPRAELIRRLQEYERFKKAADDIKKELPKQAKVIPVSAGGQALLITGATHARELLSM